jgi:hypothetical protein
MTTLGTMFGYWGIRFLSNPLHPHLTMLLMGGLALALSELGYRAGKKETEDSLVKVR